MDASPSAFISVYSRSLAVKIFPATSGDLDLHLPDSFFDGPVAGMFAKLAQVGVAGQPAEIAITEHERFFKCRRGQIKFAVERITASQIVEDQRIFWLQAGEPLVHPQAVIIAAALRVMVAENLQGLDVARVPLNNALHEADLDVEITHLSACKLSASGIILFRHTTRGILIKWGDQVKRMRRSAASAISRMTKLSSSFRCKFMEGRFYEGREPFYGSVKPGRKT